MPGTTPLSSSDSNIDRQRLNSLINSMADGVIALDEDLKVLLYNGAALNILNINTTIGGQPIDSVLKLFSKENQPISTKDYILQAKTPTSTRDVSINFADGSVVKLYLSISPVRSGFGHDSSGGYVLIMRDITREKSLEEERDEFISVSSHELRTPVAIAEGNISNARLALKNNAGPELINKSLAQAYDQIIFLSSLINDLATLSRAEGGKLLVQVEDINAAELLNALEHSYKPEAESKGLQFITEIDPHLEVLKSSGLYVKEILQNFITNAIKYTESGSISVGAKLATDGIDFWVKDTGIGISKSDQEKVFQKFFRSEDFRTRQNKGTGLGLYVTTKLAKLLGGSITLESELNKGSKFTIHIPNLSQSPQ